MRTTTLTDLPAPHVRALACHVMPYESYGDMTLTSTTATFLMVPTLARSVVARALPRAEEVYGPEGEPVQSLHAVIRELDRHQQ